MTIMHVPHRMAIRRPSLIVNCGYARVCIYANSNPNHTGCNARRDIDIARRSQKFQEQFGTLPTYSIPEEYFTPTSADHLTQFDRDCTKILDGFHRMKFRGGLNRESYLTRFSLAEWCELALSEKEQHTMSRCTRCFQLSVLFPPQTRVSPHASIGNRQSTTAASRSKGVCDQCSS